MADTPKQFADRIRAKHPGIYDDLNDNELTSAVINKHPEYGDMVNAQAKEPSEEGLQEQPLLLGPLNELGSSLLQKGAQGVANTAGQAQNPMVRGLGAVAGSAMLGGAEALAPQTKLGQMTMLAAPFAMAGASGLGSLKAGLKNSETAVQALTTSMGGIERNTQAVLNDPSILARAKSVDEASQAYADKSGLQGLVDYIRENKGEPAPGVGDYKSVLKESKSNIASGVGTPQDAQNQVQAVNAILKAKDFEKSPAVVRGLMQDREQGIGLLEQSNPGFADANKDLREAHLADFFQNWGPQNKNGSPSVLRGSLAAMNAAKGIGEIATGSAPIQGATRLGAVALSSPKMVGMGLRGLDALTQEVGSGSESGATMDELRQLSEQIAQKSASVDNLRALASHHQNYANGLGALDAGPEIGSRLDSSLIENAYNQHRMMPEAEAGFRAAGIEPDLKGFIGPESYGGTPLEALPQAIQKPNPEVFKHLMKSDKYSIQANQEAQDLEALKRSFRTKAATIQPQATIGTTGKLGALSPALQVPSKLNMEDSLNEK